MAVQPIQKSTNKTHRILTQNGSVANFINSALVRAGLMPSSPVNPPFSTSTVSLPPVNFTLGSAVAPAFRGSVSGSIFVAAALETTLSASFGGIFSSELSSAVIPSSF